MTTKFRIIFGFVCMMAILIVVSTLAYRYMSLTLTNVMEYRRSVWVNVDLLDTLAAVNETRGQMNRYLIESDKRILDNIMRAADTLTARIDRAAKNMALQANKELAQRVHKSSITYRQDLATVTANVTKLHEVYTSKVLPSSQVITQITSQFRETARNANNVPVLAGLEAMWEEYAYMLSNLGRFYYSRTEDDVKRARQRFAAAQKLGEGIAQHIVVEQGRVHHRNMMNAYKTIAGAIDEMTEAAKACQASITTMRDLNAAIRADLTTLSEHFSAQRLAIGENITADISGGERILLAGSVGGVLLGLILALIIIFGLIRVLREAGHFAAAVAGGDFDYVPKVKEGGEIGAMFTSMHQIPTVLSDLVDKSEALADSILSGHLRNRLDVTRFSGEFAHLTGCVNKVSDAYTRLIDRLGIPFICCDSGCRINFVNEPGQTVLGGNPIGKMCADELKALTCNTDKCFGKNTMSKNGPLRGETTVNVRGETMEVEVDAVPLRNLKNEVVGFMELLTDLTEVKSHEATMLRVAEEANEISNRVAAASEELSTQVELITRGTDVQRDRVSSTASAMTEMNATVLEVARSAGEASEQSEGTRVKAQQGAELVNQVMTAINAVNAVGQNLQTNMQELGKQAESIGNVMNVISDIADQTNLLALNAAIEAARAGEAGRGFAVVADEVRKLAEKTMQATHEVGASINAVQQSARINIDEVGKAVTSVAEANTLANSSGEALNEIVSMAASNSAVVASIATAAEEQSATSEEINRSIDEIHKVITETADSMVQSSSAVQILSQMAHDLRRVMDGLK